MPRTSADGKAVVPPPEALDPPPPPAQLPEREAQEWRAVVARMGPAWFGRETHAFLATFCCVRVQLDNVSAALAEFGPGLPEQGERWRRFQELTRMRGQLSSQLTSLGRALRLTPQARYDRHWAGAEARRRASRPWAEHDGGGDPLCG
jgi:phage terminase small subunit